MKTKKALASITAMALMAAALPCLGASALDPVSVSITAGKVEAAAGKEFSVDISLDGIVSPGLNTVEFAVEFDPSLVTIDSVSAGALCDTGAAAAEAAIDSSMSDTTFDWNVIDNQVCVTWVTGLTDSDYWLSDNGVFCTITGTVKNTAAAGKKAEFNIVPIARESYPGNGKLNEDILVGYVDTNDKLTNFDSQPINGSVTVSGGVSTTLYGDIDIDGKVSIGDIVLLARYVSQDKECPTLSGAAIANADCSYDEKIDANDISSISLYLAGMLTYEKLGPQ